MNYQSQISIDLQKDYKIIKQIGKGAYADVFLGYNTQLKMYTAIKQIDKKAMNENSLSNIDKEIQVLMSLKSDSIVFFVDCKSCEKYVYIILEYCCNGDLELVLQNSDFAKTGFPEEVAKMFVQQIQYGLIEMNTQQIVHRDLKLANILMDKNFQLKIADFGMAKYQQHDLSLVQSGAGTPITMAPEVLKGEKYSQQCDIWSIGVIIYQMVFGQYPFQPKNGGGMMALINLIEQSRNQPINFPKDKEVSDDFKDLINKMLVVDVYKRISMNDFVEHKWVTDLVDQQSIITKYRSQLLKKYKNVDIKFEAEIIIKIRQLIENNIHQLLQNIQIFIDNTQKTNEIDQISEIIDNIHQFFNYLVTDYTFQIEKQKFPLHYKAKQIIVDFQHKIPQLNININNNDNEQLKNKAGIFGLPSNFLKHFINNIKKIKKQKQQPPKKQSYFYIDSNNEIQNIQDFGLSLSQFLSLKEEGLGILKEIKLVGSESQRASQLDLLGLYQFDNNYQQQQQEEIKIEEEYQDSNVEMIDEVNVINSDFNDHKLEEEIKKGNKNQFDVQFQIQNYFYPFFNEEEQQNVKLLQSFV